MARDVWVVRGTLATVLRLSRVFGAAPLRFESRGDALYARVSWAHALHGIILVGILDVVVITTFVMVSSASVGDVRGSACTIRNIQFLLEVLEHIIMLSVSNYGVWTGYNRMARWIKYFNDIEKVNFEAFKHNTNKQKREKKRKVILIVVILTMLLMWIYDSCRRVLRFKTFDKDGSADILFGAKSILYFTALLFEIQFILVLYSLHAPLDSLNEEFSRVVSIAHETSINRRDFNTLFINKLIV